MDLDKEFVASVIRGGREAYLDAISRGVDPEIHLAGDGQVAWTYIQEHYREYDNLPEIEVIQAKVKCDLTHQSKESSRFFLDELVARRSFRLCRELITDVGGLLESRKPMDAAEALHKASSQIRREKLGSKRVDLFFAQGTELMKMYNDAKAGKRGIPTPWPSMDEQTLGWFPEDLIIFVARLAGGKSWALLQLVHAAWQVGKKVLIITTEMNRTKLYMRFAAMHLRMPFNDVRHGRLGEFMEKKFFKGLEDLSTNKNISILSGGMKFDMSSIERAVDMEEPDVLAIDGPWLIKNTGRDKREQVANTFDDLKRINQAYQIVTITNLQFNRQAKTGQESTISAENMAITDQAGWNADAVYGLVQTDDMRGRREMGIKPMKIREGAGEDIRINWDFEKMDFSEIRPDGGGTPGALPNLGDDDYSDIQF